MPLLFILNLALNTATYPRGNYLELHTPKGWCQMIGQNYRPIAILLAFGMVFEALLNRYLSISSRIRPFLRENEHGFLGRQLDCH